MDRNSVWPHGMVPSKYEMFILPFVELGSCCEMREEGGSSVGTVVQWCE